MSRVHPLLTSLHVFEAAARHVHFTRAANELGITQAAVSHHIGLLEKALGVRLFDRRHRSLQLTAVGKRYLGSVQDAFETLNSATAEVTGRHTSSRLVIRAYSTFVMLWLLPRLVSFNKKHPDIDVDILNSPIGMRFHREDCDLMVRYGVSTRGDGDSYLLFRDVIAPVCSPALLSGERDFLLDEYNLIHCSARPHDWSDWTSYVGLNARVDRGVTYGTSLLAFEGAKEGIGLAMGQLPILTSYFESNALVVAHDVRLQRSDGYYLTHSKTARRDSRVRAFTDWILEEAGHRLKI
jgi:LysR family transcriptional regulator, glycine cleavage system transcriptional activator